MKIKWCNESSQAVWTKVNVIIKSLFHMVTHSIAPVLSHPESDGHTYKLYILVVVPKFRRMNQIPLPQLFYFHVILFNLSICILVHGLLSFHLIRPEILASVSAPLFFWHSKSNLLYLCVTPHPSDWTAFLGFFQQRL